MKRIVLGMMTVATFLAGAASPTYADHEEEKITLVANGGTNRFIGRVNSPGNLVAIDKCSGTLRRVLLRFQVRTARGRLVNDYGRCVYKNFDSETWTWNQRGLHLGTYFVVAKATYREKGKSTKTLVSDPLVRRKVRVKKYHYRSRTRSGTSTASRTCIRQEFGNCSFTNFGGGELFVCGTYAKAVTVYRLTLPRDVKFRSTAVNVDRYNGRAPDVTKSRSGRRVTVVITRNGNNTQTCGSTYRVSSHYRKTYFDNVWVRGS